MVTVVKKVGMKEFSEDLQRLNEAWSGPIEILISVGEKDALLAYRFEVVPT